MATVVILTVFDSPRRGTAMGSDTLGIVVAPALGPTVGGMLIDNESWRAILVHGHSVVFRRRWAGPGLFAGQKPRRAGRFDLTGFVLLCLAVGLELVGLFSGQGEDWDSDFVRLSLGTSACTWIGFLVREQTCRAPLLALGVYRPDQSGRG